MKVAIDLDGVCYEWDRTARYMLREYRNGRSNPVLQQPSQSWDAIQQGVSKDDWRWLWDEGVRLGLFRYGHMVKGARIALQQLAASKVQLEVVTHRPASAVNDTLDWISLYFKDIPLHGFIILTNQEPKTISDADVLVDDKPENVVQWYMSGRTAFLFDRDHNQGAPEFRDIWVGPRAIRTRGWDHTVREILDERTRDAVRRQRAGRAAGRVP